MNIDLWLHRAPLPTDSTARAAVALQLGRAVERLQARLAAASEPVQVSDDLVVDMKRTKMAT